MSYIFITFSAGKQNYIDAGKRLINQANETELFEKTIFYTDQDLKNDHEFWSQHSHFIENNKRGYGYWLWKPYIIKKTMESMKDGDILLYLDCGCEIDVQKKNEIIKFMDFVKKDLIIGTRTLVEKDWNKMDLIIKLNMLDNKYLNTDQHQAGAILFLVCDKTRNLVNEWYEIGSEYHYIDDTPSIIPNFDCFKEHRHDQSIFSLLTKKYDLYSIHNMYYCIEYIRNLSGNIRVGTYTNYF